MPVREVRRYAELVRAGDGNEDERLTLLRVHRERVRAQLAAMADHLEAIDMKIGYYEGAVAGQLSQFAASRSCRCSALSSRSTAARLSSSCATEDAPMSGTIGSSPPISHASTT